MNTRRIITAITILALAAGLSSCHITKQPDSGSSGNTVHEAVDGNVTLDREAAGESGESRESTENASGSSDDLFACQIELNGTILTLPCKMSDLEVLGFNLPESVRDDVIGGGRYMGTSVSSEAGEHILIALYNTGDSDRTSEQCEVYEMTITQAMTADMDISIARGITYGFTKEQVEAIYGDPDSEYAGGDDVTTVMYRAQGSMIKFDFANNVLWDIQLQRDAV